VLIVSFGRERSAAWAVFGRNKKTPKNVNKNIV